MKELEAIDKVLLTLQELQDSERKLEIMIDDLEEYFSEQLANASVDEEK